MSTIRRRPYGRASTERFRLRDATTGQFASATALSAGDAQVSIDGGTLTNVTTLPTFDSASGQWTWAATASELTGKRIALSVSNGAYLGMELRIETEGDFRAQYPSDGMIHSTTASSITTAGCTLGAAPTTVPESTLLVRYCDTTGAPLAEVYGTISGTAVTHAIALAGAPTGVATVHLFSLPKETPTATTANTFADALLDRVNGVATGVTPRMVMRVLLVTAGVGGKSSGADGTTSNNTIPFRSFQDSGNAVTVTSDQYGNRTAISVNTTLLSSTSSTDW